METICGGIDMSGRSSKSIRARLKNIADKERKPFDVAFTLQIIYNSDASNERNAS